MPIRGYLGRGGYAIVDVYGSVLSISQSMPLQGMPLALVAPSQGQTDISASI